VARLVELVRPDSLLRILETQYASVKLGAKGVNPRWGGIYWTEGWRKTLAAVIAGS